MENNIGRNEVRSAIFEIINRMSEEEMHRLLKDLEEGQAGERRQCGRKDFLRVIDYNVGDHYYRDFIQNISETGLFIKPSQNFSVGQTVSMTFMSPDNQKPFKMNGEIVHTDNDGVGVKFKIESQVQRMVLKSYIDMIQR
jgi:Tfp pilus assembly protein PilZ